MEMVKGNRYYDDIQKLFTLIKENGDIFEIIEIKKGYSDDFISKIKAMAEQTEDRFLSGLAIAYINDLREQEQKLRGTASYEVITTVKRTD